jgi:O-antigen biosynthesis protein
MRVPLRTIPYVLLLFPFDVIVAIGLAAAQLCAFVSSWFTHYKDTKTQRPNPAATIIILNWDGKHLLAECLPSVIESIKCAGGNHKILVVDNGSRDGSVEFIRQNFPQVGILTLDRNYGFAIGNNRGAERAETDVIVFLNNDMVVDCGFLRPLLDGFSDPSVFAVTSQIFFADPTRRREETGKTCARFEHGFLYFWHDEIGSDENATDMPVLWAGGGSSAIDRRKFLELGGFDSLYHPFYVEDADISYQAWKRGWRCVLAPASRVIHKHRSTSKAKFGNSFVDKTIRKNQYLFIWKNVTDLSMIFSHIVNLPRVHAREMIQNGPQPEIGAFIRAVGRLPVALIRRLSNAASAALSDRDVLYRSQKA